jgi:DNA-binding transcriptional regulator YiaG
MKKWTEDLQGIIELDYITFQGVPMIETKAGNAINLPAGALERLAARAVINSRVPIRGIEVKFLRKTLGLSLEKFANKIGLTSGAVFKWEKDTNERLHPMNEIVVRVFFAEQFGIDIPGKYSELLGNERPQKMYLQAC